MYSTRLWVKKFAYQYSTCQSECDESEKYKLKERRYNLIIIKMWMEKLVLVYAYEMFLISRNYDIVEKVSDP